MHRYLGFCVLVLLLNPAAAPAQTEREAAELAVTVKRLPRGWSGSRSFGVPRLGLVEEQGNENFETDEEKLPQARFRLSRDSEHPSDSNAEPELGVGTGVDSVGEVEAGR